MEIFSRAELEYEGRQNGDEKKINLHVAGQSIVYVLDKNQKLKKMFWVSQGISMVNKAIKDNPKDDREIKNEQSDE